MLRFSILIITCFTLSADRARAVSLTLDEAPNYALKHSPQIAAARLRIAEAQGRVIGAGRLANPEIELEYLQNTRTPERSGAIAIMQRFPLTARLRLEKAVSRGQLAAAQAEVRDAERRLVSEVRAAAVKYVALRAQQDLREQQLKNSRQQAEIIMKRFGTGEASSVDAALADLETRQLAVEVLQIKTQRATLVGELRPLLGVEAMEVVEITGALRTPGPLPARGADGEDRPDLEAARQTAAAARLAVRVAQAQKWQDIGIGVVGSGERMEDAPDGLTNDYFLGFRFSLALPLWNRNEGRIAETEAAATRAELEIHALGLTIRSEAEAARGEMAALGALVREMDEGLLPKAAAVEEQLMATYGAGQTPLTEALRARTRRLELAQRRVDALRDYHLARVRYDAAVGRKAAARGGSGK